MLPGFTKGIASCDGRLPASLVGIHDLPNMASIAHFHYVWLGEAIETRGA
jgi:hypothetical protein